MTYYIYHYRGKADSVKGVYQKGEPIHNKEVRPFLIDIKDGEFEQTIKELAKLYDVMLSTSKFGDILIFLDDNGRRFR